MKTLITSVALAVLLSQSALGAEEKKASADQDTDFLVKAFTGGVAEVRLSEYVAKHAADEKVRDFADRLAKDHKALNTTLGENARRLKVAVVAGQEKETKDKLDKLSKLKGNDLDLEFLHCMIDDHEKAIKVFEKESKSGLDSDLKTVATNNLKILKNHLDEARSHLARLKK